MWRCSNCGTGVEDKYAHCWQCGAANAVKRAAPTVPPKPQTTPEFASYEQLAHVPSRPLWILRRGLLQRLVWFAAAFIFFKLGAMPFLGTYGIYIFAGLAVIALVFILWGFFRRDPSEGVGIKLS